MLSRAIDKDGAELQHSKPDSQWHDRRQQSPAVVRKPESIIQESFAGLRIKCPDANLSGDAASSRADVHNLKRQKRSRSASGDGLGTPVLQTPLLIASPTEGGAKQLGACEMKQAQASKFQGLPSSKFGHRSLRNAG